VAWRGVALAWGGVGLAWSGVWQSLGSFGGSGHHVCICDGAGGHFILLAEFGNRDSVWVFFGISVNIQSPFADGMFCMHAKMNEMFFHRFLLTFIRKSLMMQPQVRAIDYD
jgi:hypothetical protein